MSQVRTAMPAAPMTAAAMGLFDRRMRSSSSSEVGVGDAWSFRRSCDVGSPSAVRTPFM